MKNLILFSLFALLGLTSCELHIYGLTNDYNKLDDMHKSMVKEFKGSQNASAGYVFKIVADDLKSEFQKSKRSILANLPKTCGEQDYIDFFEEVEELSKQEDLQVFILMHTYERFPALSKAKPNFPIYVIDNDRYKRKFQTRYKDVFFTDLTGKKFNKKNRSEYLFNTYLLFEGIEYKGVAELEIIKAK